MIDELEIDEEDFRRRKAVATQRGNSAWLWPEVSQAAWAEAVAQVSQCVATVLAGEEGKLVGDHQLAISIACYTSGVGPLLGHWLQAGLLRADPATAALLNLHLEHSRQRAERVSTLSRSVVRMLGAERISVIALKGGHTAHTYFPHAATRPSSDLDLLVPADQAAAAEAAFAAAGMHCLGRDEDQSNWTMRGERSAPRSIWMVHSDDPWSVDLHQTLDLAASAGATPVRLDAAEPFSRTDAWPLEGDARVLRQPLLLLHLAAHAGAGLHNLSLLRMVEIILVIRQDEANGRLSWEEFLAMAELTDGFGAAFPALRLSEKLAPGTVPAAVLDRCAAAAPRRVREIVESLTPATAQRVDRTSVGEHFMWASGMRGWARQLRSDLIPRSGLASVYRARGFRLMRGQISR
jgi:hypothetical protein